MKNKRQYIPERNHIIWIDYEPIKGKEIGKYRPSLVLSSKEYSKSTGLVICCPISTSIRGARTEVAITNLDHPSVVATTLIQTLSWKDRKVKYITEAKEGVMRDVLDRVLVIIGANETFKNLL